jgi:hypothetical protein
MPACWMHAEPGQQSAFVVQPPQAGTHCNALQM